MKTNKYVYVIVLLVCLALLYPIKVLARTLWGASSTANAAANPHHSSRQPPGSSHEPAHS